MKSKIELKPNQTIVFIGDSISDASRCEPVYQPFGFGYVHFATNFLLAKYPELNLNIVNTGIGGNTIRDLKDRWEKDCIEHKPEILSVLIGVNDVGRQYQEGRSAEAVYIDEYESTYRELLSRAKQRCNCQFVLMEPFMFCDDSENQILQTLRTHIMAVHKMADEFDAVLVPLQSSVDKKIKQVPAEKWSQDMVHPYVWAHAWIAQRWLEATSL